jgi:CRP-like cAMP-binding protein
MTELNYDWKHDIGNAYEKTKILNCLYKIDEVLINISRTPEDVLRDLLEIIPLGYRYSDICKVQILCRDIVVRSEAYHPTDLKQSVPIKVEDKEIGEVTVTYIKPFKSEKGIFLPEETKFLSTIGNKIGSYLLYRALSQSIKEIEQHEEVHDHNPMEEKNQFHEWLYSLHLNDDEIKKLTKVRVNFKKGETICKQGAITSYIMILKEGFTKNFLEGYQDKGFNFRFVKPYDFIGLSSLYAKNIYHFTSSAIIPSSIYLADRKVFIDVLSKNFPFSQKIMEWYCETTEAHLRRMSCLANKLSLGRMADILIYLAKDIFNSDLINNTISRKDIAELAGLSTENAVRILSDLRKDTIIQIGTSGIRIIDMKLLETLSLAG